MEKHQIKRMRLGALLMAIAVSSTLVWHGLHSETTGTQVTAKLVALIDRCPQVGDRCTVSLDEATDFDWDRVVVFEVGSSRQEVTQALAVQYQGTTDMMSGIVFAKDGAVVHEEGLPYDSEHPNRLKYVVGTGPGDRNCRGYSRTHASFSGTKKRIDGVDYYTVRAH